MSRSVQDFIYLVKSRPALYNANLREHDDKRVVEKLWQEIAKETNNTVSYCKAKWATLRNSYARSIREENEPTPFARRKKQQWYLADSISFLKDYMNQRVCRRNTIGLRGDKDTRQSASDSDFANNSINSAMELKCSSLDEDILRQSSTQSPFFGKRLETMSAVISIADSSDDYLLDSADHSEMEDPNITFIKSILPDVIKLTERRQREFKQNVLIDLNKLLDEQEDFANLIVQLPIQ